MLDLNIDSDVTINGSDYDHMEAFYVKNVLPASIIDFFMHSNFSFNEKFLIFLSNESGLSCKMVWSIAKNIRKPEHSEHLKELIELIINRLDTSNRIDILNSSFYDKVEKMIINSKHNDQVKQISDRSYKLVEKIFSDNGSVLTKQKSVKKCPLKKVVVYMLIVILTVYLKRNQMQTFVE